MAETTISWTHKRRLDGTPLPGYTFNPWYGCQKVSPACDGCYAEALMDLRYGKVEWGPHGERVRTAPANWRKPMQWQKAAREGGYRPFAFCASLADVFDNKVDPRWRHDLFDLIRVTPDLDWLLLSKRPQNMIEMCQACGGIPSNAALGTTVEDQTRANLNVPAVLEAKFVLKPLFVFLSCEPLLSPVDLTTIKTKRVGRPVTLNALTGVVIDDTDSGIYADVAAVDWVITGGETDQGKHKARPTHPNWFSQLRDHCKEHEVPFHHKQNGEWADVGHVSHGLRFDQLPDGTTAVGRSGPIEHVGGITIPRGSLLMKKIGKKKAGRLHELREHNGYPGAALSPPVMLMVGEPPE